MVRTNLKTIIMIIDAEHSFTLTPGNNYTLEASGLVSIYERQVSGDDTSFKLMGTVRQGSKFGFTATTGEMKAIPKRVRTFFEQSNGLPDPNEVAGSSPDTTTLVVANRWHMETNNRWVGWSKSHGIYNPNAEQNFGADPEPRVEWDALGIFVKEGQSIESLQIAGRINNTEVTEVKARLYHYSGPFDGTWNEESDVTRTLIHTTDALGFTTDKIHKYEVLDLDFDVPSDGFLVLNVAPTGTITAERYLYANSIFKIK